MYDLISVKCCGSSYDLVSVKCCGSSYDLVTIQGSYKAVPQIRKITGHNLIMRQL